MSTRPSLFSHVNPRVRSKYAATGLAPLLDRALATMDEAIALIDEDQTFVSSIPAVDVLTRLPYDRDDTVYVMWRTEHRDNFWTQKRKHTYLAHLRAQAAAADGYLNQARVMVFDDGLPEDHMADNMLPPEHMFFALRPLHRPGTFSFAPLSALTDYPDASRLSFGYTVSAKHAYAVIPIPFADDIEPSALATANIGQYLEDHRDYDQSDGPMRAMITVNHTFVSTLVEQTRALIADARTRME